MTIIYTTICILTDATVNFEQAGPISVDEGDATVNVSLELVTTGMIEADLTVQVEIDTGNAGDYIVCVPIVFLHLYKEISLPY